MAPIRFSIRFKLIFLLTILSIIIIIIASLISYSRTNRAMHTKIQEYGNSVTTIFTHMATDHIYEMDYITVLENAIGLTKDSNIKSIKIFETNGKIWINTKTRETDPIPMDAFYKGILDNKHIVNRKVWKDTEWVLEFTNPISTLGRVTHLVNIEMSLKSMEEQLSKKTFDIFLLSCVMVCISVFLAVILGRLLTNPINRLVSGTKEISNGNLDYRIDVLSKDEIGELSKSFNLMTENLQSELSERIRTEEELKKHRDHLEELVSERTTELLNANRKLVNEIEERKRSDKALRNSEEKLFRSKKMESMGLLAGGVAHDLNNVLSGIVSYPELLLMDLPEDSKLRKPIETIQESGHRAAAIVQDLLTIARGVAITREPLNLNDLIRDYLNSPEFKRLEQMYPSVSVKTNLTSESININGSHVHIRKVVMNLVSNASEAIGSSGNVTISTSNRYVEYPFRGYEDVKIGDYVVLAVSDDGSGISVNDLDRIFEPFYTKKVMGRSGTGLGLAVVWNVVQDHKGYIDVKTSEKGTTFKLYLPINRAEISSKNLSLNLNEYKGNGETILVVDDVERQREISCKMLEALGYKATAVSSGEEAVEYLTVNTVDLVLLVIGFFYILTDT